MRKPDVYSDKHARRQYASQAARNKCPVVAAFLCRSYSQKREALLKRSEIQHPIE
jgi:hypothetical protein